MAKQNGVFLYGQVLSQPRIFKDENGNYIRGICAINVIRGLRDFGDNISNLKYDAPIIMTGEPEKIAIMDTWKVNDMVEVKGSITTKEINKGTICKNCGQKNVSEGNTVFVNPIYLGTREIGISKEEGLELLRKRVEISNCATLIGTLCRNVETFTTNHGLQITQYQLAVNRKYRIKDDAAENRTDYPWIKSYGSIASEDAKFLQMGAMVYVDGMIQTREVDRTTICPNCGNEYHWHDNALEIVPYAVEYLQGYILPEEYEKREEEKNQAIINSVFNS